MSLISMASPWTNDDSNTSRKRTPSLLRKTVKIKPYDTSSSHSKEFQEYKMSDETAASATAAAARAADPGEQLSFESIEDVQTLNENRNTKVNEIIDKMTALNVQNDGDKLVDFNPPPKPTIQMKKDLQTGWIKPDDPIPELKNSLQMPAPSFQGQSVNPYIINNARTSLGNYQQVYNPENIAYKPNVSDVPYYAKMGISNAGDSKLMEKINYMIHLLENQENEKTDNITEEFVLYTFLGVFIIFVLDSFSKGRGKYIR